MRPKSKINRETQLPLSSCIAIMGILNAILTRISQSLPQIKEAVAMLPEDAAVLHTNSAPR